MRILLVEDERNLSEVLVQILRKNNYTVDNVYNGEDGLDHALSNIYDVILLDISLPKMNGLEILKRFRKENKTTPVIMLTARGDVRDKVIGLDYGADDYIPKPFDTQELLARIRAVSRRRSEIIEEENRLIFGDISLATNQMQLSSPTAQITLTPKECELLEYLIRNNSIVLSKERIIEKVWGYDSEAEANHVEVFISFLRKKLAYLKSQAEIKTIRGSGYMLCLKD